MRSDAGTVTVAVGLDIEAAREGMAFDLQELWTLDAFTRTFVILLFALPVVSILALVKHRWLAVVPLAGSLGLFALWFLHYATDWWGPVSGGIVGVLFGVVILGWVVLAIAVFAPRDGGERGDAPARMG